MSTFLGHLALHREPRSQRSDETWRLEDALDGDALRPHQRRRASPHHRSAAWGKSRGSRPRQGEIVMTRNDIAQPAAALGKGEVVSSILTGSTRYSRKLMTLSSII